MHLPLIAMYGRYWSLRRLMKHLEVAEGLGLRALPAHVHLLLPSSWLEGLDRAGCRAGMGPMDLANMVARSV